MEMTMTAAEQNQEQKIIQIDLLFYGQYDNDVCRITSAFVVSKSRVDWLKDFQLPTAFLQHSCNYWM
jgi:cytochrome c oxidase subunit 3